MTAFVLGMKGFLYFKVGGVDSANDFTLLTNVRDVTLNTEKAEADVTTRQNAGWRATVGTLKNASLDFEMIWSPGNAGFTAVQEAYLDDLIIGFKVFDGDEAVSGSQGLVADFNIINFTRTEPLEDAMKVTVNAKIAFSETAPVWEEVV